VRAEIIVRVEWEVSKIVSGSAGKSADVMDDADV
jgi:hypothetical protein